MRKAPQRASRGIPSSSAAKVVVPVDTAFGEVVQLIRGVQQHVAHIANAAVIDLY